MVVKSGDRGFKNGSVDVCLRLVATPLVLAGDGSVTHNELISLMSKSSDSNAALQGEADLDRQV